MRAAVVGLLVATAFVLSGCQYLLGGMMGGPIIMPNESFDPGEFGSFDPGDFGSFDPNEPFSFPPPHAIYTTGSATVTSDGTTTTYDKLAGPSILADFGANASWTDDAGHYLMVLGSSQGTSTIEGEPEYLTIDRIAGGKHWTAESLDDRCEITVTTADKTGFSGTASCTGLRWTDALAPYESSGNPAYIEGEPAFDIEVTFEAKP